MAFSVIQTVKFLFFSVIYSVRSMFHLCAAPRRRFTSATRDPLLLPEIFWAFVRGVWPRVGRPAHRVDAAHVTREWGERDGERVSCFLPFPRPLCDCESSGHEISHRKRKSARARSAKLETAIRSRGSSAERPRARFWCRPPGPGPVGRQDLAPTLLAVRPVRSPAGSGTRRDGCTCEAGWSRPATYRVRVCVAACGRACRLYRDLIR
jgi:hypothetical protein